MAIDRDILIAVAKVPCATPNQPQVHVQSMGYPEPLDFIHEPSKTNLNRHICEINPDQHVWGNYFKAGYKGIHTKLHLPTPAFDLYCLIHSTLPAGSGLSSSSALVVASLLATLYATNSKLAESTTLSRLVEIAVASERIIGVNTGGMDQAISFLANRHAASIVHFIPTLRAESIVLGPTSLWGFVVAHSLVVVDKKSTAKSNYNLRVVETKLGATILAAHLQGSNASNTLRAMQYSDLLDWHAPDGVHGQLLRLRNVLDAVLIHANGDCTWTLNQVAKQLQVTEEEVHKVFLSQFPVEFGQLQLWARGRHVIEEAIRVLDVAASLSAASLGTELINHSFAKMSDLMALSHHSCRDMYECSHPELETLVSIGRRAGALGARLTGAGWGGATIHILSDRNQIPAFIARLAQDYYAPRGVDVANPTELSKHIFATDPAAGAGVLQLS
jgi:galactokinase